MNKSRFLSLVICGLILINFQIFSQITTTTKTVKTTTENAVTTTVTTVTTSSLNNSNSFTNNLNLNSTSNFHNNSSPEVAENGDIKNNDNDGDGRIE